MKRTTALNAATAFAALCFACQAFAMGAGMRQGHMGSHMQQRGMSGMQHGSGNGGAGGRHEAMHAAGSQHGSMNANGRQHMLNNGADIRSTDSQPATSPSVTPQLVNN